MKAHDFELLSAYLDGELKPSDSSRLETRLNAEPDLASALGEIRATRTVLRKLPLRKAPRNFTLTRKMVGQNPPLPRSYPLFRFATMAAAFLLVFSYAFNIVGVESNRNMTYFGMGGGGGDEETMSQAPAIEEPAAPPAATEVEESQSSLTTDEVVEQPSMDASSDAAGNSESLDNPTGGGLEQQSGPAEKAMTPEPIELISATWQLALAGAAIAGLIILYLMRVLSARRWK